MKLRKGLVFTLLFTTVSIFSLNHLILNRESNQIKRSVYFWKSEFLLDSTKLNWLKTRHIERIYVKIFEVNHDDYDEAIYPGQSVKQITAIKDQEIVPVVFIENTVLPALKNQSDIQDLAYKILKKAGCLPELNTAKFGPNRPFKELQIDCDWGETHKETYFALLRNIKKLNKNITLSVTLRLYPFKYREKTGVPPADRAMLMVYNLNSPQNISTENSIFSKETASAYLNKSAKYPLPLDVAMPAFEWIRVFENQQFSRFIHNYPYAYTPPPKDAVQISKNRYRFTHNVSISNLMDNDTLKKGSIENTSAYSLNFYEYCQRGDEWVYDRIEKEDLKLISELTRKLIAKKGSVAFFECTDKLFKFNNNDLNEILENYNR